MLFRSGSVGLTGRRIEALTRLIQNKSENLLSLSGVYQPKKEMKDSKIPIALTTFLSANPQIKTIVLHLDNDKVGRLCTATLKELLQKDYKIVDDPPPVGKDFNDF